MSWQDATKLTGAALGLPAEADRLVEEVQGKFVEVEETHPELAGATVVVARQSPTDAGSVMVWSSKDLRGRFLAVIDGVAGRLARAVER